MRVTRAALVVGPAVALALGIGLWRAHENRSPPQARQAAAADEPAKTPHVRRSAVSPTYRFDASRSGAFHDTRVRPPFRIAWRLSAGSLVEFPPALADGRLYITTHEGRILAISAGTGRQLWKVESGHCAASSPALAGGLLVVSLLGPLPCGGGSAERGVVLGLRASDGRELWRRAIGPSESSPLAVGGTAYVGSWDGGLYALAGRTGAVRWRAPTDGPVKAAAAYSAGSVYVGSYDGRVYALDARSGAVRWRAGPFAGHFYATPAIAHGLVIVGATSGVVYAFDSATGDVRWTVRTGSYVYSAAGIWRRTAYVGSYDGRMYAIDLDSGRVRWTFSGLVPISGGVSVVGRVVYFSTCSVCVPRRIRPPSRTYALDAPTGRRLWTFPDGEYAAVVPDRQRMYLVGYSALYGLDPADS